MRRMDHHHEERAADRLAGCAEERKFCRCEGSTVVIYVSGTSLLFAGTGAHESVFRTHPHIDQLSSHCCSWICIHAS